MEKAQIKSPDNKQEKFLVIKEGVPPKVLESNPTYEQTMKGGISNGRNAEASHSENQRV